MRRVALRSSIPWLTLLTLAAAIPGCADTCLDDGLLQDGAADCPANDANSGSTTDDSSTDTDPEDECLNGIQDGDETDIDCGGTCEAGCGIGDGCGVGEDCETQLCGEDGTCDGPTSCDDQTQTDGETDEDCGGVCGPTCPIDDDCEIFIDCEELVCDPDTGTCSAPTCEDGAPNGSETDVDCGGPDCDACPTGGGCEMDSDCLTGACDEENGQCVAEHCTNGEQDEDETDVDCGGENCAPCGGGETCEDGDDCASTVCEGNACTDGGCADGVQNGDETDVDCGGGTCDACEDGEVCEDPSDCVSEICDPLHEVCEAATCTNGLMDGDETDIDCGGPSCAPCNDGEMCEGGTDCASEFCMDNTCTPPTCSDGVENGTESDVDCGGIECDPCDDGEMCLLTSDCQSMVCLLEECEPPACDDGVQNGDETDEDCGNTCGATCEDGETCDDGADCISMSCDPDTLTCTPSDCNDGVQNGTETDVDCGGDVCGPCDDGEECTEPSDCDSGVCTDGECQPPVCDDGVQNGDETDEDCGNSCGATCEDGETCDDSADCVSMSCDPATLTCNPSDCSDGVQNGSETDVDCGGPICGGCDTDEECVLGTDCVSQVCDPVDPTCEAPTCDDGFLNGTETDVDCGGDVCGPCDDGEDCTDPSDCDSGVCTGGTCTPPACDDGVENGDETDEDCGNSCGATCETDEGCDDDADCVSLSCDPVALTCDAPACDDGILNGTETDVDCGGDACDACDPGENCEDATDCASAGCEAFECNELLDVVITPSSCADAAGGPVDFIAVASGGTGGPYTYNWTPDDGTVDPVDQAATQISPTDYASYTVTADDGVNTANAVGVTVISTQPFNLEDNCTLYQGDVLGPGTPAASITYSAGGTVATELGNNDLGLHLCEQVAFTNTRLTGSFRVNTGIDDDWAGFVWGAQDSSNFYILSWKQAAQNFLPCDGGAPSPTGMIVKRVFAADFASVTGPDLYCAHDTPNSELLLLPAESVSTGWQDNVPYTIEIDFEETGSTITVTNDSTATVEGTFVMDDLTWTDGFFGSHTMSQQSVEVGPLFGSCL